MLNGHPHSSSTTRVIEFILKKILKNNSLNTIFSYSIIPQHCKNHDFYAKLSIFHVIFMILLNCLFFSIVLLTNSTIVSTQWRVHVEYLADKVVLLCVFRYQMQACFFVLRDDHQINSIIHIRFIPWWNILSSFFNIEKISRSFFLINISSKKSSYFTSFIYKQLTKQ